ncbi:MAG TPA: TauD/TfdA family dioxygenase [Candidatus Tectomicrobia bacterium]
MAIRCQPCQAVLGAEVDGVDLRQVPDEATIDVLEEALERYGVLIFHAQHLAPAEQVAWSRAFGPLVMTQGTETRLPNYPEIFVVGNTIDPPVTFSPSTARDDLEWHADNSHLEVPARASLLYARAVPQQGGDTLFACMYTAYDTLSPAQQAAYDELQVMHALSGLRTYVQRQRGEVAPQPQAQSDPVVVRPLIRRHPRSGRKALYFGNQVSIGIVGWPEERARGLIRQLTTHACQPAYQYRHRWSVGDAVLWDNRRVLHAGTFYDIATETRLMHRTTFRETEPV